MLRKKLRRLQKKKINAEEHTKKGINYTRQREKEKNKTHMREKGRRKDKEKKNGSRDVETYKYYTGREAKECMRI